VRTPGNRPKGVANRVARGVRGEGGRTPRGQGWDPGERSTNGGAGASVVRARELRVAAEMARKEAASVSLEESPGARAQALSLDQPAPSPCFGSAPRGKQLIA
jgi:hypothetical protein